VVSYCDSHELVIYINSITNNGDRMKSLLLAGVITLASMPAFAWDTTPPPAPSPSLTTNELNARSLAAARSMSLSGAQAGASAKGITGGSFGGSVTNNNNVNVRGGGGIGGGIGFAEAGNASASPCGQSGFSILGFGYGPNSGGGGLFSMHHDDRQCELWNNAMKIAAMWCVQAARAYLVKNDEQVQETFGVKELDPTCPPPPPPPAPVFVHHYRPKPPVAPCPEHEVLKCVPKDHPW